MFLGITMVTGLVDAVSFLLGLAAAISALCTAAFCRPLRTSDEL
jgi:hypothetical protein